MSIHEIQSAIESIANNAALYQERNFEGRAAAIDDIEFHVLDRIEGLLQATHPLEQLHGLNYRAHTLKEQLAAIDDALFERIRADICRGACSGRAFKQMVDSYVAPDSRARRRPDQLGYDTLDLLINGLLRIQDIPQETHAPEPEMVSYQQTPVRIILELVAQANLCSADRFYDIGSGLGHVPILVNLLCGAVAKGIEYEPAYCSYASRCAVQLNRSQVEFIHSDARLVDYDDGTVFFLYTPFTGSILQTVLDNLRIVSEKHMIRICTYGPCTQHVAHQRWLKSRNSERQRGSQLVIFDSL